MTCEISVIIVARNEQDRIDECIMSILEHTQDYKTEVILVDSNSSDKTVDIAKKHPVKIYKITQDKFCSASAGRYIGVNKSNGENLLFIDGDMVLTNDWIKTALDILGKNPSLAGVSPQINSDDYVNTEINDDVIERKNSYFSVQRLGGLGLYDRDLFLQSGGFDPDLPGYGDVDLGYRIKRSGFELGVLSLVGCEHPKRPKTVNELVRRWNAGHYVGMGMVLRKSIKDPIILLKHLHRLRWTLAIPIHLLIALGSIWRGKQKMKILIGISFSAYLYNIISHGTKDTVKSIVLAMTRTLGIIKSVRYSTKNEQDYLENIVVVQE